MTLFWRFIYSVTRLPPKRFPTCGDLNFDPFPPFPQHARGVQLVRVLKQKDFLSFFASLQWCWRISTGKHCPNSRFPQEDTLHADDTLQKDRLRSRHDKRSRENNQEDNWTMKDSGPWWQEVKWTGRILRSQRCAWTTVQGAADRGGRGRQEKSGQTTASSRLTAMS